LLDQGDVSGACEVGVDAVPVVAAMGSTRTAQRLAALRCRAEAHPRVPATRDLVDCYEAAF
jgi:hypothetical protein